MKRIPNKYHQDIVLRNFNKNFPTVRFEHISFIRQESTGISEVAIRRSEQLSNVFFSFVWFVFLESFRDTFTKCNATVIMSRNYWECEAARSDIKLTTLLV